MGILSYTVDFMAETGTIIASRFGLNFSDIANFVNGQISSVNLHPSAGITKNQLRDRYIGAPDSFWLIPWTSGADYDAPADFNFPNAATRILRKRRKVRSGDQHMLVGIDMWIEAETAGVAPWPQIDVYKNGTAIPGASFIFDADNDFYEWERSSMFDSPLLTFTNEDILEYRVLSSTGAGNPNCRGVFCTEWWKIPLIP